MEEKKVSRIPYFYLSTVMIFTMLLGSIPNQASAARSHGFTFPLVVSAGAASCLPNASGTVNVTNIRGTDNQLMQVSVSGLPRNTGFDFFVIQDPVAPFGLSWYQGDIQTNRHGKASAEFIGKFNIETFIVAPGATSAPVVFTYTPFPDDSTNPATGPVHTYHLGLWFNSFQEAAAVGCPDTVTPFSGEHTAGIQVLHTLSDEFGFGPLAHVK